MKMFVDFSRRTEQLPCALTLTQLSFSRSLSRFSFFIYIFTTHVFLHTQQKEKRQFSEKKKTRKYFPNDCFSLRLCLHHVRRIFSSLSKILISEHGKAEILKKIFLNSHTENKFPLIKVFRKYLP